MPDRPDPKEVKLLADILALVLEDQPGQSSSALDAVRRRAQASRITGGAIKNLFVRLSAGDVQTEAERAAEHVQGTTQTLQRDLAAARLEIAGLQSERHRLQRELADLSAKQREAVEDRRRQSRLLLACGGIAVVAFLFALVSVITLRAGHYAARAPMLASAGSVAPFTVPTPAPAAPAPPPRPAAPSPSAATNAGTAAPPVRMSEEARRVIGEHVRTCGVDDGGVARPSNATFDIQVQVDETGTIRGARLTGVDEASRSDPRFRTFADHAVQALLDPRCATLPLPLAMLGRRQTLDFHFAP